MAIHQMIELGNKLELQKVRHVEFSEEVKYVSKFLYQKSADEAVIEMPSYKGSMVVLEPEDQYQVCFFTNKGLYRCIVEVADRFYEDNLPVAVVRFQSDFEKLQRRQYYRMECVLDLTFRPVTQKEAEDILWMKKGHKSLSSSPEEKIENTRSYAGVALDISGGGIRFNSEFAAQPGDTVLLSVAFATPDAHKLRLLFAKILTVSPVANRKGLYEHRAEFAYISNDERESIIRYVFMEERNRRKKDSGMD